MKGYVRKLNIALNMVGVLGSLFGIICVVKIAFIRPWEVKHGTSMVELGEVSKMEPIAGKVQSLPKSLPNPKPEQTPLAASPKQPSNEILPPPIPEVVEIKKEKKRSWFASLFSGKAEDKKELPTIAGTKPIDPDKARSPRGFNTDEIATPTNLPPNLANKNDASLPSIDPTNLGMPHNSSNLPSTNQKEEKGPLTVSIETPPSNVTQNATSIASTPENVVKLNGAGHLNSKLAAELVLGYVQHLGFSEAQIHTQDGVSQVIGRGRGGDSVCIDWQGQQAQTQSKPDNLKYQHIVGIEGVSMIVHPENPISRMTIEQIASVFAGRFERWSQMGSPSGSVNLYICDDDAETFGIFKQMVLKPSQASISSDQGLSRLKTSNDVIDQVARDPGAIGFIPISNMARTVKYIGIKASEESRAIKPSRLSAEILDYPLARPIYINTREITDEFSQDFVRYVSSAEGQAVVEQAGFIGGRDLTQEEIEMHDEYVKSILEDSNVLPSYKNAIKGADRLNSRYNLRFVNAENVLTSDSEVNLGRLTAYLTTQKQENSIILIGFSDSIGKFKDNQELSRKRAEMVATLLREKGFSSVRAMGYGEEMPIGNNDTPNGRAINRRVEVWLRK